MKKDLEIIDAQYLSNYNILLFFNDGKSGVVNLENELWGTVFEQLKDKNYFKNFRISDLSRTIEWENGADLSPEFLYDNIQ